MTTQTNIQAFRAWAAAGCHSGAPIAIDLQDGVWYWVRYEGLGQTYEAPAVYKADADAFYSHEFSGIPARQIDVIKKA